MRPTASSARDDLLGARGTPRAGSSRARPTAAPARSARLAPAVGELGAARRPRAARRRSGRRAASRARPCRRRRRSRSGRRARGGCRRSRAGGAPARSRRSRGRARRRRAAAGHSRTTPGRPTKRSSSTSRPGISRISARAAVDRGDALGDQLAPVRRRQPPLRVERRGEQRVGARRLRQRDGAVDDLRVEPVPAEVQHRRLAQAADRSCACSRSRGRRRRRARARAARR